MRDVSQTDSADILARGCFDLVSRAVCNLP